MKRYSIMISGLALAIGIFANASFAQNTQQDDSKKREFLREQLMQTYQNLVAMDDQEWQSTMLDGARRMEKDGKKENARVVYKLANPSMRSFALNLFKDKIDEASQNGLIWLAGPWYCYGMGCFWLTLMTIMTLDGNEAVNY